MALSTIAADLSTWRPQRFGGGSIRKVADPLIEPAWEGLRVLVRVGLDDPAVPPLPAGGSGSSGGSGSVGGSGLSVTVLDEDGEPLTELDDLTEAIAAAAVAAGATSLVLDGYLTGQATQAGEGLMLPGTDAPSVGSMATQLFLGSRGGGRDHVRDVERASAARAASGPLAFVAIDLLLVDDERTIQLPLLERKRLLDSAFAEGELVRRTPFIRPPVDQWMATWRGMGFGWLAYKSANSRYRPGERNPAWATIRIPQR